MKIKLSKIITEKKPGGLVNVDINDIKKKFNIEFNPNKIFYLTDLNSNISRGNHSNYNASEILICMAGSFEINLHDGKKEENFKLCVNEIIYVPKNTWLKLYNFVNCVILVFVDVDYEIKKKSEYNFKKFKKINQN